MSYNRCIWEGHSTRACAGPTPRALRKQRPPKEESDESTRSYFAPRCKTQLGNIRGRQPQEVWAGRVSSPEVLRAQYRQRPQVSDRTLVYSGVSAGVRSVSSCLVQKLVAKNRCTLFGRNGWHCHRVLLAQQMLSANVPPSSYA